MLNGLSSSHFVFKTTTEITIQKFLQWTRARNNILGRNKECSHRPKCSWPDTCSLINNSHLLQYASTKLQQRSRKSFHTQLTLNFVQVTCNSNQHQQLCTLRFEETHWPLCCHYHLCAIQNMILIKLLAKSIAWTKSQNNKHVLNALIMIKQTNVKHIIN